MSVVTITRLRPVLLSVVFLKKRIISSVRSVFWNRFQTLRLQFRPQESNKTLLKAILFGIAPAIVMTETPAKTTPTDVADIITQADRFLEENKIREAFDLLQTKKDVEHVGIQWRLARICYRLGKYHTSDKARSKELANIGLAHADKAIALDGNSFPAYRWKGVLLNWSMEFEGYKKQIEKSFEIRENFAKACELDPNDATARHLLGRWCYEVSDVPWYMRKAAQYIFATPPSSSFEEALQHFEEAEKLKPGFYSSNWLYIGKCYIKLGKNAEAKPWLQKTVTYNGVLLGDDIEAIDEAKQLLKNL